MLSLLPQTLELGIVAFAKEPQHVLLVDILDIDTELIKLVAILEELQFNLETLQILESELEVLEKLQVFQLQMVRRLLLRDMHKLTEEEVLHNIKVLRR